VIWRLQVKVNPCYKGECYERGSARLHAQPGDHIYVHYKDYTLPKPFGIDGCTMSSSDFVIDSEPYLCDHLDIYNFAKVKEATPLSEVALTKVSITPYHKPYVSDLNDKIDSINDYARLVKLEENRIQAMGYEITPEVMSKHSGKYDGLLKKINELEDEVGDLKYRLSHFNNPSSTKKFIEGEEVIITGTFTSTVYSPNQFVFAYQIENTETGYVEKTSISQKENVTKKKSVDVSLGWVPDSPGEYIVKLYVMDATNLGAVMKNTIVNHIHVEPAVSTLGLDLDTTKN